MEKAGRAKWCVYGIKVLPSFFLLLIALLVVPSQWWCRKKTSAGFLPELFKEHITKPLGCPNIKALLSLHYLNRNKFRSRITKPHGYLALALIRHYWILPVERPSLTYMCAVLPCEMVVFFYGWDSVNRERSGNWYSVGDTSAHTFKKLLFSSFGSNGRRWSRNMLHIILPKILEFYTKLMHKESNLPEKSALELFPWSTAMCLFCVVPTFVGNHSCFTL